MKQKRIAEGIWKDRKSGRRSAERPTQSRTEQGRIVKEVHQKKTNPLLVIIRPQQQQKHQQHSGSDTKRAFSSGPISLGRRELCLNIEFFH